MQRYDFFFRQKVTEGELDAAFDAVETFEFNTHLDQGIVGIQSQAIVTENAGTPNLTVDISGPAVIRDQLGQRINWTATQDVDCSVDENSNSTAVTTPGNERWLSIFAKFVRVESDPRLDGTGATVFFDRAESFEINVVQGAEALISTATRPPLRSDEILLADVRIENGTTQILNAEIYTDRREDAFVITLGGNTVRAGQAEAAINAALTLVPGAAALADDTAPDDGATLVGVDAIADSPDSTAQGTLKAVLTQLLGLINDRARLAGTESITGDWTHDNADVTLDNGADLIVQGGGDVTLDDAPITLIDTAPLIARLLRTQAPSGGSGDLIAQFRVGSANGNNIFVRVYVGDFGFAAAPEGALLITHNARWTGTQWAYDDGVSTQGLAWLFREGGITQYTRSGGSATPWSTATFETRFALMYSGGVLSNYGLRIAYAGMAFHQENAGSQVIEAGSTWTVVNSGGAPSSTGITVLSETGTTGADSVTNATAYGATASKATTAASGIKRYIVEIDAQGD